MAGNKNLQAANKAKKDEFYTQLADIENELRHYREHFRGKTVLCNCDDPRASNFFRYFAYSFEQLGLKRLITTCYKNQHPDLFSRNDHEQAVWLEYLGDRNANRVPDPEEIGIRPLRGDGDFRSPECIELLKQADIVVTNPPFSLFREYVAQLVKYEKKFLIIGNMNAITYRPKSVIRPPIWVYPYLLTGDERSLPIRAFSPAMAQATYERQQGICPHCGKCFEIGEMEAVHTPPLARRRAHRGFQLPNALPGMQPSQVGDIAHWQGRNKESPGSSWGASGAVGCCVLGARH